MWCISKNKFQNTFSWGTGYLKSVAKLIYFRPIFNFNAQSIFNCNAQTWKLCLYTRSTEHKCIAIAHQCRSPIKTNNPQDSQGLASHRICASHLCVCKMRYGMDTVSVHRNFGHEEV
mmetsp:Transcript_11150/g.33169  ORF Transcript_11150/g.33169 Transcript_11150/m.33169 type:complete len:117 (-) Transcript_11150:1050-1400(-)|eukprot:272533-Chlamydomonas_euryale.AAC.2